MNRKLAALGVSLGVLGGGVVGFVATSGSPSASAEVGGVLAAPRQATDTTVAGSSTTDDKDTRRADRLTEVLAPLVENGTITQAQADAVIAALQDAMPMGGRHHDGPMGGGPRGDGPMGGGIAGIGGQLDDIVGVLGLDIDDVMSALRDGKTIAELAEEQGVDVQKVIDAAVAAVKEHLDEAVASGDHTQAEADDLLAKATDAVTKLVNGDFDLPFGEMGGMGGGMGHHGGPFGRHGGDDSSDTDTATTTTLG